MAMTVETSEARLPVYASGAPLTPIEMGILGAWLDRARAWLAERVSTGELARLDALRAAKRGAPHDRALLAWARYAERGYGGPRDSRYPIDTLRTAFRRWCREGQHRHPIASALEFGGRLHARGVIEGDNPCATALRAAMELVQDLRRGVQSGRVPYARRLGVPIYVRGRDGRSKIKVDRHGNRCFRQGAQNGSIVGAPLTAEGREVERLAVEALAFAATLTSGVAAPPMAGIETRLRAALSDSRRETQWTYAEIVADVLGISRHTAHTARHGRRGRKRTQG